MGEVGLGVSFARVLRKHRMKRGMTQEQLAEKAALHPTYISRLESRDRTPTIEVAQRLAHALGQPLWTLIREAERGTRRPTSEGPKGGDKRR